MTIANGVNKNVNQFMTDFSEYIECIFDTVEYYIGCLVSNKSKYSFDDYIHPITEMIEVSIDNADSFTKLNQRLFSDSLVHTEVYRITTGKGKHEDKYEFHFTCNGAVIKVRTRYVVFSTIQTYIGIKHPSLNGSIVPQDTARFASFSAMNTKYEDCVFQMQNLIWTALMLKDIEMLSDLLMFVPKSGEVITEVVSTMLNMTGDNAIPIKTRTYRSLEALRNRFGMSNPLNRCIARFDNEYDEYDEDN